MRNLSEIILTNGAAINVIRNIAGMDPGYTIQRKRFMQEAEKITIVEGENGFKAQIPDLDLDFLDDNIIMDQIGMTIEENYSSDTSILIQIENTSHMESAAFYASEEYRQVAVKDEKYNDLKYILADAA